LIGHRVEDSASKLLEVSEKAQDRPRLHFSGYARATAVRCNDGSRTSFVESIAKGD
jgi:hypothetical protein